MRLDLKETEAVRPGDLEDYRELRLRAADAGLFERQPAYYVKKTAVTLVLLGVAIALLLTVDAHWLKFGTVLLFALVWVQIGLIGHDIAHHQVFRSKHRATLAGAIAWNCGIGLSSAWWIAKHNNSHHAYPNQIDRDPDITFPVVVFSMDQTNGKTALQRFIISYQAFFYVPLIMLVLLRWKVLHVAFLSRERFRGVVFERIGFLGHHVLYCALLLSTFSLLDAVVFAVVHHALAGLYMGLIFGPNHKGMPIFDRGCTLDPLRLQIVTARNVREDGFGIIRFLYGGLHYQIEHHLLPDIPRYNLPRAQSIVKPFCQELAVPYSEGSLAESWKAVFHSLHQVSAPLRSGRAA